MHHKKRDFLYDNIKGIIVYFIVLIHFIGATIKNDMLWAELLNTGVALTSMSVLLFVSGFFSKNPRHNTVEAVIQRLLIPYLLISAPRSAPCPLPHCLVTSSVAGMTAISL